MPTEYEMKEFFQSVIDNVATLSTQAARVEGLEQRINDLHQRVSELQRVNEELRQNLAAATSEVETLKHNAEVTQSELQAERNVAHGLRDTIIQRDSRVHELDTNLNTERDSHKITMSERDDARRNVSELQEMVHATQERLDNVSHERDQYRDRASDLENEVHELRQRLDRINAVLNPLRAFPSADVA